MEQLLSLNVILPCIFGLTNISKRMTFHGNFLLRKVENVFQLNKALQFVLDDSYLQMWSPSVHPPGSCAADQNKVCYKVHATIERQRKEEKGRKCVTGINGYWDSMSLFAAEKEFRYNDITYNEAQ